MEALGSGETGWRKEIRLAPVSPFFYASIRVAVEGRPGGRPMDLGIISACFLLSRGLLTKITYFYVLLL